MGTVDGGWKTLDAGMGGVGFAVEDDTGRVAVDPAGAEFHFEDHRETVSPGDGMSNHLAAFVATSPEVDPRTRTLDLRVTEITLGNRHRFTERRLDVGERVYVYGQATAGGVEEWGSDRVDSRVGDDDTLPAFVISDADRRGDRVAYRTARPVEGGHRPERARDRGPHRRAVAPVAGATVGATLTLAAAFRQRRDSHQ